MRSRKHVSNDLGVQGKPHPLGFLSAGAAMIVRTIHNCRNTHARLHFSIVALSLGKHRGVPYAPKSLLPMLALLCVFVLENPNGVSRHGVSRFTPSQNYFDHENRRFPAPSTVKSSNPMSQDPIWAFQICVFHTCRTMRTGLSLCLAALALDKQVPSGPAGLGA